jgi:hypothetical protein
LRIHTFALMRLTSSFCGAPFFSCRLLYTSTFSPAITYASTAWKSPPGTPYTIKYVLKDIMP